VLETDEQRRWWFATHPEYSWSRTGTRDHRQREEKEATGKVRPEDVDAYVDEALKYEKGPVAELLKSVKRNCGTEGVSEKSDHRLAHLDAPRPGSDRVSSAEEETDEREATLWDALVTGADDSFQVWDDVLVWLGGRGVFSNHRRRLARNLDRAGMPRPPGHAAHHIVEPDEGRFRDAIEARKILEKFGIDIDGADNGVWLPYKYKPAPGEGTYHPSLHTKEYYRQVEKLLRNAATKEKAIATLKKIGRQLSGGKFPK
jgi:hypothetical protein